MSKRPGPHRFCLPLLYLYAHHGPILQHTLQADSAQPLLAGSCHMFLKPPVGACTATLLHIRVCRRTAKESLWVPELVGACTATSLHTRVCGRTAEVSLWVPELVEACTATI
eukprot:1161050-Pelagomonas_calceolata.AAC.10